MKKTYQIILATVLINFASKFCVIAENSYTISICIKNMANSWLYFSNKPPSGYSHSYNIRYFDSVYVKFDTFEYKGHFKETSFMSIELPGKGYGWFSFILDTGKYNIIGNADSIWQCKVIHSEINKQYSELNEYGLGQLNDKRNDFVLTYESCRKKNDTICYTTMEDSMKVWWNKIIDFKLSYIKNNPKNFISLFLLDDISSSIDISYKEFIAASQILKNKFKSYSLYKKINGGINLLYKKLDLSIFSLRDTSMQCKNIFLGSKNYTLLVFWASWYSPSIVEVSEVIRIFYDKPELKIYGISLDSKSYNWINSIQYFQMPYENLSELEGNNSKLCNFLSILSIPKILLFAKNKRLIYISNSILDMEKYVNNLNFN